MVQANPQILQVCMSNCFGACNTYTRVYMFMHDGLLFNIVMMTAYASSDWKAKSSLGETYPEASSWFSSFDQWTCWRRRVSYLSMSYLFKLVNPFFCTNLRGAKISGMYLEILVQQCHRLWLLHLRNVKPLNAWVTTYKIYCLCME